MVEKVVAFDLIFASTYHAVFKLSRPGEGGSVAHGRLEANSNLGSFGVL